MGRIGLDNRDKYICVSVVEGYNRWASTYDSEYNPLIVVEEGIVLELAGDVQGLRVLDLGCGTARYCALLAKQDAQVVGVDLSWGMLAQAVSKKSESVLGVVQGSLSSLCFPDDHFDLVVCGLTLNHIRDLEGVFEEATRVLKQGGVIVISDFHPYWIVFGHGYTEFFDETGQEYRIECFPHLFEEYWRLWGKYGLRVEEVREPRIDAELVKSFPALEGYQGIPLALVAKLLYSGGSGD